MKPSFFYDKDKHYELAARAIKEHINSAPDFLSAQTARSTRAAGDAIEGLIAEKFPEFLRDWCKEYWPNFARRAMADVAFKDKEDFYCVVDVKTHREDTEFNMPNLTSVKRISSFYKKDKNIFALVMVKYVVNGNRVEARDVTFVPIEFLDWECLTIGALGWGQIQIANSNRIKVNHGYSRKKWMLTLCETMLEFYPEEIGKIEKRISRFEKVKASWEKKQDIWV